MFFFLGRDNWITALEKGAATFRSLFCKNLLSLLGRSFYFRFLWLCLFLFLEMLESVFKYGDTALVKQCHCLLQTLMNALCRVSKVVNYHIHMKFLHPEFLLEILHNWLVAPLCRVVWLIIMLDDHSYLLREVFGAPPVHSYQWHYFFFLLYLDALWLKWDETFTGLLLYVSGLFFFNLLLPAINLVIDKGQTKKTI